MGILQRFWQGVLRSALPSRSSHGHGCCQTQAEEEEEEEEEVARYGAAGSLTNANLAAGMDKTDDPVGEDGGGDNIIIGSVADTSYLMAIIFANESYLSTIFQQFDLPEYVSTASEVCTQWKFIAQVRTIPSSFLSSSFLLFALN